MSTLVSVIANQALEDDSAISAKLTSTAIQEWNVYHVAATVMDLNLNSATIPLDSATAFKASEGSNATNAPEGTEAEPLTAMLVESALIIGISFSMD